VLVPRTYASSTNTTTAFVGRTINPIAAIAPAHSSPCPRGLSRAAKVAIVAANSSIVEGSEADGCVDSYQRGAVKKSSCAARTEAEEESPSNPPSRKTRNRMAARKTGPDA
jgi:hypothetical protein